MHIDPDSGLLDTARQVTSSNADERPARDDINLVVIHSISLPPGEYGNDSIERFFCNNLPGDEHPYFSEICDMQVSAHVLIRRDGEIIQFVPFHMRAWHAGASVYEGRERCNDFSIGIELEGTDDSAFTDEQYHSLSDVIACLEHAYPGVSRDRLAGHSDIAPGRKTDPGPGFDWVRLQQLLGGTREAKQS